jgi:hypothetical protein
MAAQVELSRPLTSRDGVGLSQGFLVSSWIDGNGVLGGGAVLSLLLYWLWRADAGFLIAATLFAIFSDLPHVLQSAARVWLDPNERSLHGRHFVISFAIIGAVVTVLAFAGELVVLLVVWVCWQFFHVVKQHYGMFNIYAAKAGYAGDKRMAKYMLFACCIAPFLYRLREGMGFSDYVVFGSRLPFSNLSMPTPPIPALVIFATYCVSGALLSAYVFDQIRQFSRGDKVLPWVAQGTLALAILSYNLSYLFVSDLYALILIATVMHSFQYHVISFARNSGRLSERQKTGGRELLLRLWEPKLLPLYFAGLFALGAAIANCELIIWGIIPLTIVLHHFYMDTFLWKAKWNPRLAVHLGIVKPRAPTSADGLAPS